MNFPKILSNYGFFLQNILCSTEGNKILNRAEIAFKNSKIEGKRIGSEKIQKIIYNQSSKGIIKSLLNKVKI